MIRLLTVLFLLQCYEFKDHTIPSYFRSSDAENQLLDRADPSYDRQIKKPFIEKILREDANAVVKVSPSVIQNGETVQVTWAGVQKPHVQDFVALYCPINDNPSHYLDYFNVTRSQSWLDGTGTYKVILYNIRTDCIFKYYRNNKYSQLVAKSNIVTFENGPTAPLHGHLAMTSFPDQMRVMWVSAKLQENEPIVRYGLTEDLNMSNTNATVKTYKASDMCQGVANSTGFIDPGFIYDILLKDLKPNTKYYYAFGGKMLLSETRNFTTPLPGGDPTPYKAIFYGDMGLDPYPEAGTTAKLVYNEVMNNDIKFIFHNGDISYARGYAYLWDQWFELIEPYATLTPYMIGIGNHEYDHTTGGTGKDPSGVKQPGGFRPQWFNGGNDSGGECSVPMFNRFHMPDNGNAIYWYSYDYGLVHYVMTSTEHDCSPGTPQYTWLENDLRSVDRSKTPWVIVAGHRAMYCSQTSASDYLVATHMQMNFEDLLYKYKVDLALWAHYHLYERTCKLYKNKCQEDGGILHLVIGSAGKSVDPDVWYSKPWSVYHINDYGYGRLTVANATSIYWEWIQNRSNKVLDYVWLHK